MRIALTVFKSAVAGAVLSAVTVAAFFGAVALGASFLVAPFVLFGSPSASLLSTLIPTSVFYLFFPEGGGPAFIGLSVFGTLLQLFILFSVGSYFLWFARRSR